MSRERERKGEGRGGEHRGGKRTGEERRGGEIESPFFCFAGFEELLQRALRVSLFIISHSPELEAQRRL